MTRLFQGEMVDMGSLYNASALDYTGFAVPLRLNMPG